jgi:hypothetical protein
MKVFFLKTTKAFVFLGVVFFLLGSCKKNVVGPKGDSGTPGTPGNLKISYTNTFELSSSSWTYFPNLNHWSLNLFVAEINSDVLEKGEVKLYMKVGTQWQVLPYGKNYVFMQYNISHNFIGIVVSHIHGGIPERPLDGEYRVVVFSPA